MKIRKKVLDFEYEEVLDARTRELIRVGCAVAVGRPHPRPEHAQGQREQLQEHDEQEHAEGLGDAVEVERDTGARGFVDRGVLETLADQDHAIAAPRLQQPPETISADRRVRCYLYGP